MNAPHETLIAQLRAAWAPRFEPHESGHSATTNVAQGNTLDPRGQACSATPPSVEEYRRAWAEQMQRAIDASNAAIRPSGGSSRDRRRNRRAAEVRQ